MEDMVDELSEAMRNFRTRVLERNEMEAWQKLIRVLTHEIMNSITPIISLSETLSEREMSEKNYPVMRQGMQTIHRRSKGLLEFVENYRKLTRLPAPVRFFKYNQFSHSVYPLLRTVTAAQRYFGSRSIRPNRFGSLTS